MRAWERVEALYGPGSLATYTLISPEDAALMEHRLDEALTVLLDPNARRAYDERLAADSPPPRPSGARPVMRVVRTPFRLPPVIPPRASTVDAEPLAESSRPAPDVPPVSARPAILLSTVVAIRRHPPRFRPRRLSPRWT